MGDSVHCLLWDKNLGLTPWRESRLQRVMGDLLKFTREYSGILVSHYPPGTDTNKPWGILIK